MVSWRYQPFAANLFIQNRPQMIKKKKKKKKNVIFKRADMMDYFMGPLLMTN